jgi:hypothetical protein
MTINETLNSLIRIRSRTDGCEETMLPAARRMGGLNLRAIRQAAVSVDPGFLRFGVTSA